MVEFVEKARQEVHSGDVGVEFPGEYQCGRSGSTSQIGDLESASSDQARGRQGPPGHVIRTGPLTVTVTVDLGE